MTVNIFRQAKQLLDAKPVSEMTDEEVKMVDRATMPLLMLRHYNDIPISDGLEELAMLVEEANSYQNR